MPPLAPHTMRKLQLLSSQVSTSDKDQCLMERDLSQQFAARNIRVTDYEKRTWIVLTDGKGMVCTVSPQDLLLLDTSHFINPSPKS